MQVKSHHMQDLQLVGFFVNMGSFRFCFALSTRAHGVPFLHTSGAHLSINTAQSGTRRKGN